MVLALSGCIVSGPPDYHDPAQTPPVLSDVNPSLLGVLPADTGRSGTPPSQYTLTAKVRSEDVGGDGLIALLYLDYGDLTNQVRQPALWTGPARTFSDTSRTVTLPWSAANQPTGCHTLTMEVTHASNVTFAKGVPVVSLTPQDDVAFATWWVNIYDDPTSKDATSLSACKSQQ